MHAPIVHAYVTKRIVENGSLPLENFTSHNSNVMIRARGYISGVDWHKWLTAIHSQISYGS
jgi:hypothetical protein